MVPAKGDDVLGLGR